MTLGRQPRHGQLWPLARPGSGWHDCHRQQTDIGPSLPASADGPAGWGQRPAAVCKRLGRAVLYRQQTAHRRRAPAPLPGPSANGQFGPPGTYQAVPVWEGCVTLPVAKTDSFSRGVFRSRQFVLQLFRC